VDKDLSLARAYNRSGSAAFIWGETIKNGEDIRDRVPAMEPPPVRERARAAAVAPAPAVVPVPVHFDLSAQQFKLSDFPVRVLLSSHLPMLEHKMFVIIIPPPP